MTGHHEVERIYNPEGYMCKRCKLFAKSKTSTAFNIRHTGPCPKA